MSRNDITANNMNMKSLMELDTGQDILLIPSSNSSFTSLPVQMEVLDSKSIKQIQNFYRKSNLENKSTEVDEEEEIPEEIEGL